MMFIKSSVFTCHMSLDSMHMLHHITLMPRERHGVSNPQYFNLITRNETWNPPITGPLWEGIPLTWWYSSQMDNIHYDDVIMSEMASQIISPAIVYSTVYSRADQRNIKAPRHWPLWGEFTGEFPAQRASNAENVFIWWRHHVQEVVTSQSVIVNRVGQYSPFDIILWICRKHFFPK